MMISVLTIPMVMVIIMRLSDNDDGDYISISFHTPSL